MSYASHGEKIFDSQDPQYSECSPPKIKRSDHRLKRFYSTFDRRAWDFCESIRYRHFYECTSGSQTCLDVRKCHQYVPLEDLIAILMADKDAKIKELEDMLRECCKERGAKAAGANARMGEGADTEGVGGTVGGTTGGTVGGTVGGLAGINQPGFQEMEDSREMLRKAMHKLQNIDEIVNENKRLQCRLRCSEERVKYLEQRKKRLEDELSDLRSKSRIQIDLEKAQEMLAQVAQREGADSSGAERDQLEEKIKQLEKELMESKKKESEIEMLKKQSKSNTLSLEELSRENECYRKKLASMKCLEKQIQDIKKQGLVLADKYKRESQKAAEQMRKMSNAAKELQALRAERDSLLKRVDELASHEGEYRALQCKLKRVDAVIAENEMLNNKLMALDKLEKENEFLKCRLDQIQEMEMNAIEDKERIMQLQCAVADQEEEMKDMLCQIERLTSGRAEEEMERLKCELYETCSKLKLCEEQLAEIPMLEAEIDELRKKLQCCCREFAEKKTSEQKFQKIEVRLPSKSTSISVKYKSENQMTSSVVGVRKEEKVNFDQNQAGSYQEILLQEEKILTSFSSTDSCKENKEAMTCEEVQSLLQSSKGIISCVLEDMIEHHKEMEELEQCNKAMKNEIEMLKAKVGHSDTDEMLCEIKVLKKVIEDKDLEIARLTGVSQKPSQTSDDWDMETLKDLNQQMKAELEATCSELKNLKNLEKLLEMERQARCRAERMLQQKGVQISSTSAGEKVLHEEDPEFDCCKSLQKEINDLKLQILELNNLTNELKKENELLRELQQPCPDFSKELDEKCALENLLSLLQAELDTFKGQKMTDECEALRNELKRVLEQNCQLKALVDCYRQRLSLEKKSTALKQMAEISDEEGRVSGKVAVGKVGKTAKELGLTEEELAQLSDEERARLGLSEKGSSPSDLTDEEIAKLSDEERARLGLPKKVKGPSDLTDEEISKLSDDERARLGLPKKVKGLSDLTDEEISKLSDDERARLGLPKKAKGLSDLTDEEISKLSDDERARLGLPKKAKGLSDLTDEEISKLSNDERARLGLPKKAKGLSDLTDEEISKLSDDERARLGLPKKVKGPSDLTDEEISKLSDGERARLGLPKKVKGPSDLTDEEISKLSDDERARLGLPKKVKGPSDLTDEEISKLSDGERARLGLPKKVKGPSDLTDEEISKLSDDERARLGLPKKVKGPSDLTDEEIAKLSDKERAQLGLPEKGPMDKTAKSPDRKLEDIEKAGATSPGRVDGPSGQAKTVGPGAPSAQEEIESAKNLTAELEKMKKLLEEKDKALKDQQLKHDEMLKARENDIKALQANVEKLKEEKIGQPGTGAAIGAGPQEDCQKLLKQMEEENAEKMKKLIDQHQKELTSKEKAYNDNLNSMKAGYETDIRKLAERHKASIMRLQGLHEDEVKEMNTDHENQMEMMQTQSEMAMNDIARGSAAKIRKLAQQHDQEMKNAQDKENKYKDKINRLQDGLTKSMQELEELRRQAEDGGESKISQLRAQHSREMQKMKKSSLRRMSLMTSKYEGLLAEEKRKSEAQLNSLKKNLKEHLEQERGDGVCDCKFAKKKARKYKDPTCPLDFNDILEKILEQGLESLSFNEIALVHRKSCCALKEIVLKSNVSSVLEPPVGEGCFDTPLLQADKDQLLQRIIVLENEIVLKQKQTQEAILSMEVAIKKERCRLQDLKNVLQNEQQKNSELKLLLTSQTKLHSDLKKERDRLGTQASLHQTLCMEKTEQLNQEIQDKKYLESEIERLRVTVQQLCQALEMEKQKAKSAQGKEFDFVQSMKSKLEHSFNQERRLAMRLENEIKSRMELQCQLQTLKQSFQRMVNLPAIEKGISQSPLESKSVKEKKNLDQIKEKKSVKGKTVSSRKHRK